MNLILMPPSLEHITYVTIATGLWSQDDVRDRISNLFNSLKYIWQEIEEIVANKAYKLPLPVKLQERLFNIICHVGLQILSWMEFHTQRYSILTKMPDILLWTPHGTIDKKRTAEVLVKDKTLDVEDRYVLACLYCLVDDIIDLHEKCFNFVFKTDDFLLTFWSDYLKENDNFRRVALINRNFLNFAVTGNEAAIRYFCLILNTQNTEHLKLFAVENITYLLAAGNTHFFSDPYCDTFYFLVCTMNAAQQAVIFERHTYEVLKSLLVWPRHSLFLETVKDNWNFLTEQNYYFLLHDIIDRMHYKRNCFSELFEEFWHQTPKAYKQFVKDQDGMEKLCVELENKNDFKSIELICQYLCSSMEAYI